MRSVPKDHLAQWKQLMKLSRENPPAYRLPFLVTLCAQECGASDCERISGRVEAIEEVSGAIRLLIVRNASFTGKGPQEKLLITSEEPLWLVHGYDCSKKSILLDMGDNVGEMDFSNQ